MWALKVLARPILLRQIGVPKGFPLTAGDKRITADLIDSFFPVALKTEGVTFDAFVADPDVNNYPLEALTVPVLIIHAKDDPLVSYQAARRAAGHIPGARLVSTERGGHLFLGDREDRPGSSPPSRPARMRPDTGYRRGDLPATAGGRGGVSKHRQRTSPMTQTQAAIRAQRTRRLSSSAHLLAPTAVGQTAVHKAVQVRAEVAVRHRHMVIWMGGRGQLRPAAGTAGRSFPSR